MQCYRVRSKCAFSNRGLRVLWTIALPATPIELTAAANDVQSLVASRRLVVASNSDVAEAADLSV